MVEFFGRNGYPSSAEEHLKLTDAEIISAMASAVRDKSAKGHEAASRVVNRAHFKVLYDRNESDVVVNPRAATLIGDAAKKKFDARDIRTDRYVNNGGMLDFPVKMNDGRIESARGISNVFSQLPVLKIERVYIEPSKLGDARLWLGTERPSIIVPEKGE